MEVGRNRLNKQHELSVVGSEARETTGWDPYEVWRTRVLLPRLGAIEPPAPGPGLRDEIELRVPDAA